MHKSMSSTGCPSRSITIHCSPTLSARSSLPALAAACIRLVNVDTLSMRALGGTALPSWWARSTAALKRASRCGSACVAETTAAAAAVLMS